ncbi:DUF2087 domain-containing protein [Anaeromonas frigoriresistens]
MDNQIFDSELNEIKNGYKFNSKEEHYKCLQCGDIFEIGRIYEIENRLYEAYKAIKEHNKVVHGGVLENLLSYDKKYTGITEKQSSLLKDISKGLSDKEIAKKNGIAPSTVRHQRFILREKAKQAKLYLAIFESVELLTNQDSKERLVKPHGGAKMLDERYIITNNEHKKVINTYFESQDPLILKSFPSKEKRKISVLREIASIFDQEKKYTEKELNNILKLIYPDIATIRRYLIEYGFFDRTKDCSSYWIKER